MLTILTVLHLLNLILSFNNVRTRFFFLYFQYLLMLFLLLFLDLIILLFLSFLCFTALHAHVSLFPEMLSLQSRDYLIVMFDHLLNLRISLPIFNFILTLIILSSSCSCFVRRQKLLLLSSIFNHMRHVHAAATCLQLTWTHPITRNIVSRCVQTMRSDSSGVQRQKFIELPRPPIVMHKHQRPFVFI